MGAASGSSNLNYGFPSPGPQKPTGQKVMDHVFFLSEEEWKKSREEKTYDLVIIGTGFCGYAIAHRALSRNPFCKILMIERGPFFLPEHFQNLPTPYVNTLGGLSETFPWTLSEKTANGKAGTITWQHGMVPFFGGRSTLWSAWCPRPKEKEMIGWPIETIKAMQGQLGNAEKLLNVQIADEIDSARKDSECDIVQKYRPIYGALQTKVQDLLANGIDKIDGIYRSEPAHLASDPKYENRLDFEKFSVPSALLELLVESRDREANNEGASIDIVTNCLVQRILNHSGVATGLETSRGNLALRNSKLILAMGSLPPATLIRNSFPELTNIGERFSAHFISAIVARIPRDDLDKEGTFGDLEIGACYVAGTKSSDFGKQYHIQLTALADKAPDTNAELALKCMPDVVATASRSQLKTSKDYVVFVCAVLGELDFDNKDSWFRGNPQDDDVTTNSLLQVTENQDDAETWDAMDKSTFELLEKTLSVKGADRVEYWHGDPNNGDWQSTRPTIVERRVPALVHESSTLHLGTDKLALVDTNYQLKGTENVFVTGGALWPQGGSWNPTLAMVALALDLSEKLVPSSKS